MGAVGRLDEDAAGEADDGVERAAVAAGGPVVAAADVVLLEAADVVAVRSVGAAGRLGEDAVEDEEDKDEESEDEIEDGLVGGDAAD